MTIATADTDMLVTLTADIVGAHVSNNSVSPSDVPVLITNVFNALTGLKGNVDDKEPVNAPAVSVRSSVKPDYLICLEDGKKLKMLKRYLRNNFQMTPDEYREKWNLPADYPMIAPSYAARRKEIAHSIGLGLKKSKSAPPPTRKKLKIAVTEGK